MKEKVILGSLIVLFIALAIPNVSASAETVCESCHGSYYNAVNAIQHAYSGSCLICHRGAYDTSTHTVYGYIGYQVTAATCTTLQNGQPGCHASSGSRPVDANTHTGNASRPADCTQCHFANTTQKFIGYNISLYTHDHNFTVEYNFYNYNISGMPLSPNGVGKGMFPYYTCTLTCHKSGSKERITIDWNQSKHAQSFTGSETNSCAKCKSPPNYNVSAPSNGTIAAADWQGIQCRVCHNMHNVSYSNPIGGKPLAFYNATATSNKTTNPLGSAIYDQVHNATELCEKCHTTASHDSKYDGVHKDTVGFDCADCHVNATFSNSNHSFEVKNPTSGVEGCAVCHNPADHTWQFTSKHTNVECWACHDQTVSRNASGYAVGGSISYGNYTYGIYQDSVTNNWTTYKLSHNLSATWVLHNISKSVSCDKCHNATSPWNGSIRQDTLIGPNLTCSICHSSYASAVNSSQHNQTLNANAPGCTDCHAGYQPSYGHTTGAKGYVVNGSNTCINCHNTSVGINNRIPKGFDFDVMKSSRTGAQADCTQCHFPNTTTLFNLNTSLYTHDHNNLTIEHNFYAYNQSGTIQMPLKTNGGVGLGQFPYWTCTQFCHGNSSGLPSLDNASITWVNSKHAQSSVEPGIDNNMSCAKCKSPLNYNASTPDPKNTTIAESDWQGIQCRVCHNLMNISYSNPTGGKPLAFYNGTASSLAGYPVYDQIHNATELCEKCHQPGSSHDSKFAGTHKDPAGANFTCADCHLNTTSASSGGFNNKSHSFEVKNVYTGATGCEVCHSASDHNNAFQFTSNHTGKVTCEACHDKTVTRNATGYAMSSDNKNGLYLDSATGLVSSWKGSAASPTTWPLHNISKDVSCNKCHGTKSAKTDILLAPTFGTVGCVKCHPSYASAVNNSMHSLNASTQACTGCHTGYDTLHNGYTGYIVNESNACRTCHINGNNGFYEEHTGDASKPADCTQCHFANTTKSFSLNASLYTHDHNLTVEYNFYNYNLSGMPLGTNGGVGKGVFPYYTCTLTCHNGTGGGQLRIENETSSWNQSKHAQSLTMSGDNNVACAKCKSPPNYNDSIPAKWKLGVTDQKNVTIAASDWQGIQCRVCHNMHNISYSNSTGGFPLAFYNATATSNKTTNPSGTAIYDLVHNATELCENCHTGSSHDSKYAGFHKDTLGFDCADCHANTTFNNATHLFEVKNTTSGVTGCEVCHDKTSAHSNFIEYSIHNSIVTCEACHDNTVARNSSDFVVNVSVGMAAGLYKDTSTNEWTTYKVSHGSPATWPLHNISKSIDCNKCHGARSVYSGAIAPNLTSGGTEYYTTNKLVNGYSPIVLLLNPNPILYAGNLLYTSPIGIPGVTKVLKWDSDSQRWVDYQYILPSSGTAFYYGTNYTMDNFIVCNCVYFIGGNASTVNQTYTFAGTR